MNIRFSDKTDVPQLKHIWKVCFGDSDDYINMFFQHLYTPGQTVVACSGETAIGVVYLLKASLLHRDFLYGYAIGVLPEFRGNSVCQKMLEFIREEAKQKNILFGLHPANDKLFSFYKRIGLEEMYCLKTIDASHFNGCASFNMSDISAHDYFHLREQAFAPLVSWDEKMLAYMITEARSTGGFAKKILIDGRERILLGRVYDKTVLVKETTMSDEEIKTGSQFLKQYYHAEKIIYTLPEISALNGKTDTTILGFDSDRHGIYMNLFLD